MLRYAFVLSVLLLCRPRVAAQQEVGQWQRFEAAATNARSYDNPFRDVRLDVTYSRPDGSTVDFWGFYDGDGIWRIRFMPDQLGTWHYEANFSDGTEGLDGTFEVIAADVPGMLSLDEENPIWFGFKGGAPLLVRSFHVGDRFFAENWDDPAEAEDGDARTLFLNWAQRQGYNMLSVASHYLNRESDGRGAGWDTPDLWLGEARRPAPAEYRKTETILDTLAARHLMVYPFAGFFGKESDYPRGDADRELYVRYTLARLAPYWNVLLQVGGPEPLLDAGPYLTYEEIDGLGALMDRLDVFDHPLSVHNPGGGDPFMGAPWLSYGTLQGPKTLDYDELSRGLRENHHPEKPLYAQETLWPGNMYHPEHTPETVRKSAYVMMMAAAAINVADMDGNSSSGFSGTLDLDDRVDWRHDVVKNVWDFFETFPFRRMRPRQDLVSRGYAIAEEGSRYLVYLPDGGTVDIHLDNSAYRAEWINAQDVSDRRPGGVVRSGRGLAAPPEGDDWLLDLRVNPDIR